MSIEDEEGAFASVFLPARRVVKQKVQKQKTAERHASMTEKEHARLGRARPVQVNFRSTSDFKEMAAGLAKFMGVSAAEMYEEAVISLAKKKGFRGGHDAS